MSVDMNDFGQVSFYRLLDYASSFYHNWCCQFQTQLSYVFFASFQFHLIEICLFINMKFFLLCLLSPSLLFSAYLLTYITLDIAAIIHILCFRDCLTIEKNVSECRCKFEWVLKFPVWKWIDEWKTDCRKIQWEWRL